MSKRHKHADQIIFWANNADSKAYFRGGRWKSWTLEEYPSKVNWYNEYEYVVVPSRYQHLWEAYLEGRLEYNFGSGWDSVQCIPEFHRYSITYFRVKPDPEVAITIKVDSVETDLKGISKEILLKAWEAAQ